MERRFYNTSRCDSEPLHPKCTTHSLCVSDKCFRAPGIFRLTVELEGIIGVLAPELFNECVVHPNRYPGNRNPNPSFTPRTYIIGQISETVVRAVADPVPQFPTRTHKKKTVAFVARLNMCVYVRDVSMFG